MDVKTILDEAQRVARGVIVAVVPLTVFFLVYQQLFMKLPRSEVQRVLGGTAIAALGLFLFLFGVNIGLLPFGRAIGETIGKFPPWMLVVFGLVLGFVTTWGEAGVRILASQVEEASVGAIRQSLVVTTMSIGVAFAVALGLLRIAYGIPLVWIVVPAYVVILAIMWVSDDAYVSIAIDGGGVATGPLANTVLLALALGAASANGAQDPFVAGLGLVALIAVAPVISIMVLGFILRLKERGKES